MSDFSKIGITFGAYDFVYTGTTDIMEPRIVPAITLRELNDSGGYYFMYLFNSWKLHSNIWEELPIYNVVIWWVE